MKSFQNTKIAKLAAIGAAISLFSGAVGYAAGEWENIWVQFDSVNLKVNGQNVTSSNLLYNDRTYVPLRACAEMLGSTVGWDQNTNTASILANTTGSANTAKIEKIRAAARIMKHLESILVLSANLDTCYLECIIFANSANFDVSNLEESYSKKIQTFNEVIDKYNNYLEYIDKIKTDMQFIGMDNSKIEEMMDNYGKCIDYITLAYEKLVLGYTEQNNQIHDEGISLANQAFDYTIAGDKIRRNYFDLVFEYSQK